MTTSACDVDFVNDLSGGFCIALIRLWPSDHERNKKMPMKWIDKKWGTHGVALLPESLRIVWASEPLPEWIVSEFALRPSSTYSALGASIWASIGTQVLAERQRNFLLNLVHTRRQEIQLVRVFPHAVPYWLNLKEMSFSTRTRNCLVSGNLLGETDRLSTLTFGDLFGVRSMGVVSILEFTCMIEAVLEHHSTEGLAGSRSPSEGDVLDIIAEPWADQIGRADPRFADLLPPLPQATVLEMLDALTQGPDTDATALSQLASGAPALRSRIDEIAALPLESQLANFMHVLSRFEGDRLQAMIDRFGWRGTASITLEEAGQRLGITRERFRQLQEKVSNRLKAITYPVYMPALDAALQVLADASPIRLDAAAALLRTKGISKLNFSPACVIEAASACGREPPIQLQTVKKKTIVAAAPIPFTDTILRTAYRQAHASGASNVGEIIAEMAASGVTTDEATVRHVLREFSEVEFLDEDWFCHRPLNPERDRLRNATRKMLSVAAPIELGLLREGVRREYKYRGHRGVSGWSLVVPPRSVLKAYYQTHPEFIVDDGDQVRPADPLDYRVELAFNDAILVDVLRSSPASVMDRSSLAAECARRSMNLNTFSLYLTYSAIIVRQGPDVWSLRGVRVDPAAVEAVLQANSLRPREKRVLDHGWAPNGRLWLAARVPAAHDATAMTVGIPGAIKSYVVGRDFAAQDGDGVSYGRIKISDDGQSWGFSRFLRQRGADEGDVLVVEFDLAQNIAWLRLGDDETLDELSPQD